MGCRNVGLPRVVVFEEEEVEDGCWCYSRPNE
jgi:hypothetical protein